VAWCLHVIKQLTRHHCVVLNHAFMAWYSVKAQEEFTYIHTT